MFSRVPGSAEMPSAARPFTDGLVTDLVTRGVVVAPRHAAHGRVVPGGRRAALRRAVRGPGRHGRRWSTPPGGDGRRVVAVGTTVVRALETTADAAGRSHPGQGWTELVVTPERGVRVVDGLLTGWHEPESSHLAMLEADRAAATCWTPRTARRWPRATAGTSSATATSSCPDSRLATGPSRPAVRGRGQGRAPGQSSARAAASPPPSTGMTAPTT